MTEISSLVVTCPGCRAKLFYGGAIKGVSVITFSKGSGLGLCKRCKTWVPLPIFYNAESPVISLDKSI
jgi:hypothetical protein